MWLFKKKKVIDFTEKVMNPKLSSKSISESEYKDLGNEENALGFLGTLASSSASSNNLNLDKSSSQHLKVRIEDVEYKIDILRKKLDSILDRLDLAEKKIDRENRS